MKTLFSIILLSITVLSFSQKATQHEFQISKKWQDLLDKDFSNFEKFVGVPHSSVKLEGYAKSDDVRNGTPLGLNNDPKNVMTMIEEDGELLFKVTGEIYAGLTTLQEFENYHLKAQFKWGEKVWEPRLTKPKDNGILYHCHGEHGEFWNVWMSSLEFQIIEEGMGDFVGLVRGRADIYAGMVKKNYYQATTSKDTLKTFGGGGGNPGYCHVNKPNENPDGEWNTLELICVGNQSLHVVNGKVVMVVRNSRQVLNGKEIPLSKGKIQLQSEGAESYYKDVQIKSVSKFPKAYKKQAGL